MIPEYKGRIQHKHDTPENWNKAANFIPLQGEIIVYDPDDTYSYARFKIGDGETNVNLLPFINKEIDLTWSLIKDKPFIDKGTGDRSVEENGGNEALGDDSHAEGNYTIASGNASHSEGVSSQAIGMASHAENSSIAFGDYNHSEGKDTLSGRKAFKINSISDNVITISDSQYLASAKTIYVGEKEFEGLAIGDVCNVIYGNILSGVYRYINYGTIASIVQGTTSGTTKITITKNENAISEKLPFSLTTENYFWVPTKPYAGYETQGESAHSEGIETIASGEASHSEGYQSSATNDGAHAEGYITKANGRYAHSEGSETIAEGETAHAEGRLTNALGISSHAEGRETIAEEKYSHAEGYKTTASGEASHTEGATTTALYRAAHAEGTNTIAGDANATDLTVVGSEHAEGYGTKAFGPHSHAEGYGTTASGKGAHAEGYATKATGTYSYASGRGSTASGDYSHTEGHTTKAAGVSAHAEGFYAEASGNYSHAEGNNTKATGQSAHTEGIKSVASSQAAHAEGSNTIANAFCQHVEGKFNKADSKQVHILGNGSGEDEYDENGNLVKENRSNAHTVDWYGNAWYAGNITVGANKDKLVTVSEVEKAISLLPQREESTYYYDSLSSAMVDIDNGETMNCLPKSENSVVKVTWIDGGTSFILTLLKFITETYSSALFIEELSVVIDLNNYGLTFDTTGSFLSPLNSNTIIKNGIITNNSRQSSNLIAININGNVTFENVKIRLDNADNGTFTGIKIGDKGNLTLNNCEIEIKNTTKITNAIENNGVLEINNSTVKALSPTAGQARGILSKIGKVTINDSYIYTDTALGQSTAFLNVAAGTEAHLNNSTFFADAHTNSNELSPDQYGRAIYNKGTIYADGITVVGTCYGWSDFAGAVTYAQNSTIKSCGHGYYNHGTAYFVDCTFKDEDYDTTLGSRTEEEFTYATDDRQGRYAPIYVGDTNDTVKCDLYLDGCTIDVGKMSEAIVVHQANGVTHNVYLSNCEVIKTTSGSAIRLSNATTFAYVGVGGNITTDMTGNPTQMVFTNELYRKKTPNSILNFNDFEALKNYMPQVLLGVLGNDSNTQH